MRYDKRNIKLFGISFRKKSLYKSLTWRAQSVTIGFIINSFFIDGVGRVTLATVIQAIIGTMMYYLHEKLWREIRRRGWLEI